MKGRMKRELKQAMKMKMGPKMMLNVTHDKTKVRQVNHVTAIAIVDLLVAEEVVLVNVKAREVDRVIAKEVTVVIVREVGVGNVVTDVIGIVTGAIAIVIHAREMVIKMDILIRNIHATDREIVVVAVMRNEGVGVVKEADANKF